MATILVIDDDEQLRAFMRAVLEGEGHAVREASDGLEGIRAYRQEPPDLVISDVFMDRQDGLQTILSLRSEFPPVKIIAVSGGNARVTGDYLRHAEAFGAGETLHKPFSSTALVNAVNRMLLG